MAVHLTRIYTRTGDDGTSGLSDFSRVEKSDPRLIAYADCDEANAALGVAVALGQPGEELRKVLLQIQNDLFDAGADLSTPVVENPEYPPLRITEPYIERLEAWCDHYNEDAAGAELVHPARRHCPVGAAACRANGDPARRTLGLDRGEGLSRHHQRAAGPISQSAVGLVVHPVARGQPGRRRAVAARRRRTPKGRRTKK